VATAGAAALTAAAIADAMAANVKTKPPFCFLTHLWSFRFRVGLIFLGMLCYMMGDIFIFGKLNRG
jgi:hypothetical protein